MLAVAPAEAKPGNKIKTVVGCVESSQHHYQLSTTTKKGKPKVYDLGDRDFHDQVATESRLAAPFQGRTSKSQR